MLPTDPRGQRHLGRAPRGSPPPRLSIPEAHLEQCVPLTRVAAEAGLPLRTAQRWVSRYQRFGLAGLSRAAGADQGMISRLAAA
jgi:hypothetical protein